MWRTSVLTSVWSGRPPAHIQGNSSAHAQFPIHTPLQESAGLTSHQQVQPRTTTSTRGTHHTSWLLTYMPSQAVIIFNFGMKKSL